MEAKYCIFDGGPIDCQERMLPENESVYEVYTFPSFHPGGFVNQPVEDLKVTHIYKEDAQVPGHFIYVGVKQKAH